MGDKQFRILLYAMIGVIVVFLCVISFLLGVAHGRGSRAHTGEAVQAEAPGNKRDTVVNKENIENVAAGMEKEKMKPTSYEAVMNTEWKLEDDGMTVTNAYVENSYGNSNAVWFDVALDDDEPLYTSSVIPVGSKVTDIKFERPVPGGRHKATVTYHLIDKSGEPAGIVKAGVTLVFGE